MAAPCINLGLQTCLELDHVLSDGRHYMLRSKTLLHHVVLLLLLIDQERL